MASLRIMLTAAHPLEDEYNPLVFRVYTDPSDDDMSNGSALWHQSYTLCPCEHHTFSEAIEMTDLREFCVALMFIANQRWGKGNWLAKSYLVFNEYVKSEVILSRCDPSAEGSCDIVEDLLPLLEDFLESGL